MSRRLILIGAFFLVFLGWLFAGGLRTDDVANAPAANELIAPKAVRPIPAESVGKYAKALPRDTAHPSDSAEYKIDVPFTDPGQIIKQVKSDAEKGVPGAMVALGTALHTCSTATSETDDEIVERAAKQISGIEAKIADSKLPIQGNTQAIVSFFAQNQKKIRDSCKDIAADDVKDWHDWLKRAARSGDAGAREALAATLDDAYPEATRLEHYEEYINERDDDFNALLDEVGAGNCGDSILNRFREVSPDATSNYIFQSLLLQRGIDALPRGDWSAEANQAEFDVLQTAKAELAARVPPGQLAQADATINYLKTNFCD